MRFTLETHKHYLKIALLTAERATCRRAKRGCLLVDERGQVLGTGYNGVPRGVRHCTEAPCPGAGFKSGEGLEKCLATHAEQNALLQCRDVERIHTCYTTASPCITCVKLLMNTNCRNMVFAEEYPHREAETLWKYNLPSTEGLSADLLVRFITDRSWIHVGMTDFYHYEVGT